MGQNIIGQAESKDEKTNSLALITELVLSHPFDRLQIHRISVFWILPLRIKITARLAHASSFYAANLPLFRT